MNGWRSFLKDGGLILLFGLLAHAIDRLSPYFAATLLGLTAFIAYKIWRGREEDKRVRLRSCPSACENCHNSRTLYLITLREDDAVLDELDSKWVCPDCAERACIGFVTEEDTR